jgi:hypothetical protein
MLTEIDIYRSADVLIHEHGEDADLEAAMRPDAMLAKGDLEGEPRHRLSPQRRV